MDLLWLRLVAMLLTLLVIVGKTGWLNFVVKGIGKLFVGFSNVVVLVHHNCCTTFVSGFDKYVIVVFQGLNGLFFSFSEV